jgi:hypothetical protein
LAAENLSEVARLDTSLIPSSISDASAPAEGSLAV